MTLNINYKTTNPLDRDKTIITEVNRISSINSSKSLNGNKTIALICGDSHSDTYSFNFSPGVNTIRDANVHALAAAQAGVAPVWKKFATAGFTPAQWEATHYANALAAVEYGKTVLFLQIGTNSSLAGQLMVDIKNLFIKTYNDFSEAGCYVCFHTVPPKNNNEFKGALEFNNWLINYFAELPNVKIIDDFKYLVDGTSLPPTNPVWKTGLSTDTIHRTNAGALVSSSTKSLLDVFRELFVPYPLVYCNQQLSSYGNFNIGQPKYTNVLANPLMVGADGNNRVPNWTVSNTAGVTAVYSKEPASDGFGEVQVITFTIDAANTPKQSFFVSPSVHTLAPTGSLINVVGNIEITSATNLKTFELFASWAGTRLSTWNTQYLANNAYQISEAKKFMAATIPVVSVATTDLKLLWNIEFMPGVVGSAVIKIGRCELNNFSING